MNNKKRTRSNECNYIYRISKALLREQAVLGEKQRLLIQIIIRLAFQTVCAPSAKFFFI